jgi:hypothetical protein
MSVKWVFPLVSFSAALFSKRWQLLFIVLELLFQKARAGSLTVSCPLCINELCSRLSWLFCLRLFLAFDNLKSWAFNPL